MGAVELYGFLWHAFPYTTKAKEAADPIGLPHWTDLEAITSPAGIVLLEDRGGWHRRLGHNGFLILSEQPVPPPVPTGWWCLPVDLPDGWGGGDRRGRVEVVVREAVADGNPAPARRHLVQLWSQPG